SVPESQVSVPESPAAGASPLERIEALLEPLEKPGDVQAIDQRMMHFNGHRHTPSAAFLRTATENQTRNGIVAATNSIRECRKTNPWNGRVINQIVLAFCRCVQRSCSFGDIGFRAGEIFEIGEPFGHWE